MGLFGFGNNKETQEKLDLCNKYAINFLEGYSSSHRNDINELNNIADLVNEIFNSIRLKDFKKELSSGVTVEMIALNIVQNVSMHSIQVKSNSDLFFNRGNDVAYELYNYINNMKLEKGMISKQSFDEHKELVDTIKYGGSIRLL